MTTAPDSIDTMIIEMLSADPRATVVAIAEATASTPYVINRSVDELRKSGLLKGPSGPGRRDEHDPTKI